MKRIDPFSPLDVRFISRTRWILLHDLIYHPTGEIVKKGLETDFASIPRLFHSLLDPFGRYAKPSIFHDDGYQHATERTEEMRKKIDDRFLEMMVMNGVPWIQRNLIHRAVRDFGSIVFHRKHEGPQNGS